jgi:hypothetical protein
MVLSLGFGVLVDLDHFIDYWYSEGRPCFDLHTFLRTRYWQKSGRVFILFHAFEYLPVVFLVWQALKGRKWAVAATAAMSSHVLAEHFVNELRPLGYFILYRLAHGFRASELIDWERTRRLEAKYAERKRLAEQRPLPWYSRLAAQFI